jgi:lipid-A-disaccharide synthase
MGNWGMNRKHNQSGRPDEINAELTVIVDFRCGVSAMQIFRGVGMARGVSLAASMDNRLYVVAGELSGDAHGAGMLSELCRMIPGLRIRGAGGPAMAAVAGPELDDWVDEAAVMGIWEVLKRYGWFRRRFDRMLADLCSFRPDVLVLIDYPGFNLRFADAVKRACPQTRIVWYVSPQVWAWNRRRIPKMARLIDEMICLFPFEQPIFEEAGISTTFVGHPLVDELAARRDPRLVRDPQLIGLFPGSREREVDRLFPLMIDAARLLREWRADLRFETPAASPMLAQKIRAQLAAAQADNWVDVGTGTSHSLMQRAACAVIASGTATLEAAFLGLPHGLVYRVAPLTYAVAKRVVKIRHIGIVNILAQDDIVEEWIQDKARPETIASSLRTFIEQPNQAEALRQRLAEITSTLGSPGVHRRVAEVVARAFAVGIPR